MLARRRSDREKWPAERGAPSTISREGKKKGGGRALSKKEEGAISYLILRDGKKNRLRFLSRGE